MPNGAEKDWYDRGLALYKANRYDEALRCFDKALEINDHFEPAWHARAIALGSLHEHREAIKCINKAIALNPQYSDLWVDKGLIYEDFQRYEAMPVDVIVGCYDKALEIDPINRRALFCKEKYTGKYGGALKRGDGSLRYDGNSSERIKEDEKKRPPALEKQMKQTREELKEGDVLGGQYEIKKVINKGGMGSVYIAYDKKTFEGLVALKSFKEADSWDEETREGLKREAYTWINLGWHPNIVPAFSIEKIHGKIYLVIGYVDGCDLGDLIDAGHLSITQSLDFAIQFCHGMEYASDTMKIVHRDIKPGNILIRRDGALRITDLGCATSLHFADIIGLTPQYASPEQFQELIKKRKIADTRSDIYSFGVVLYEMLTGNLPFSANSDEEWAYQHLSVIPSNPSIVNEKVPPKLAFLVIRCLEKNPDNRYQSFRSLKEELMHIYKEITKKRYELPDLEGQSEGGWTWWNDKGIALSNLGKYEEALTYFNRALEIEQEDEGLWNNKGSTLDKLGKHEEAIKCLNKALEIHPNDGLAWNNKGLALEHLMKHEEAIKCYEKALEISPLDDLIWINKGIPFKKLKRYDDAVKCYNKALEINPLNEGAWNNKGLVFDCLKRYDGAIQCYDKALEINPQDGIAWTNKGSALRHLKRYDEAIQCYNKALKINPQNEGAWGSKGNVLYGLKKYDEAIQCYDRILEFNPLDEKAWTNKATVYWNVGNWKKVVECYDKLLELAPHDTEARKWREKALQELATSDSKLDTSTKMTGTPIKDFHTVQSHELDLEMEVPEKLEDILAKRNELNTLAKRLVAERERLNDHTKTLIEEARKLKDQRDRCNDEVKRHKKKREEYTAQVSKLKKDLSQVQQQTTPTLLTETRKRSIDSLQQEISRMITKAKEEHVQVARFAREAQEFHEHMVLKYEEATNMRDKTDEKHHEFVHVKQKADQFHQCALKMQKKRNPP